MLSATLLSPFRSISCSAYYYHLQQKYLTKGELFNAPEKVRNFFKDLRKENLEAVKKTDEAVNLAKNYIAENVVGKTSTADCVHIALATIHKVDILVSWNFKHIVNG